VILKAVTTTRLGTVDVDGEASGAVTYVGQGCCLGEEVSRSTAVSVAHQHFFPSLKEFMAASEE
jgi:hypothetical protein